MHPVRVIAGAVPVTPSASSSSLREAKLGEHFTRVLTEKWCMALQESLRTTGEPDRQRGVASRPRHRMVPSQSRRLMAPARSLASNRDIQIPG
jgi:hypothetical protein